MGTYSINMSKYILPKTYLRQSNIVSGFNCTSVLKSKQNIFPFPFLKSRQKKRFLTTSMQKLQTELSDQRLTKDVSLPQAQENGQKRKVTCKTGGLL